MLLGQIAFSCWELIFAIFLKDPVPSIDNVFVFVKYVQKKYIFSNNTTVMRTLCKTSNSLYCLTIKMQAMQILIYDQLIPSPVMNSV